MLDIVNLDHIVLRVKNPELITRFYCDVLGCTVERVNPKMGLTQLRAGASLIDLVDVKGEIGREGGAAPGVEGHNVDHLCLRVREFDAEKIGALLTSNGATPGEVRERYGADGYGPSLYFRDPEGNRVELKGPPTRGLHS
ncbi:MAG TPA: VOC family protein [Burkholderiales bacterium]|jgi:glyoxylase I family protein|nr:VOC family protein [Burkholderiales bacterium]